ncbi:hypothetical protein FF38_00487 [Lucilia cuprina]|uniref:Transmembrane protein n=1 Tax=Lucilia cuprina TaxID=7375 RepID=A0A0L0CJS1_LUCCU|nr:hypothetical protein FF38_00487 [Lucilia cuprina]
MKVNNVFLGKCSLKSSSYGFVVMFCLTLAVVVVGVEHPVSSDFFGNCFDGVPDWGVDVSLGCLVFSVSVDTVVEPAVAAEAADDVRVPAKVRLISWVGLNAPHMLKLNLASFHCSKKCCRCCGLYLWFVIIAAAVTATVVATKHQQHKYNTDFFFPLL